MPDPWEQYQQQQQPSPQQPQTGPWSNYADQVEPPQPQPQEPPWYAPGSETGGLGSRLVEFVRGGVGPVAGAIRHPVQAVMGMGQPSVTGMTPGGYPAFAPTGDQAQDIQNQQVQQQAQQLALQQGREMVTQHPAYLAGSVLVPAAAGLGAAKVIGGGIQPSASRYFGTPYSAMGDQLATAMKPVSGLDMPALASATIPSLQESFADLGANPAAFTGRAGTRLFKTVVQHAIDIHEDRAAQVMAPIIGQPTPQNLLANAPDLVEYLGGDPANINNTDVNVARIELNKQLGRGNYFLKSPSKQLNAPESQIDALNAAGQARQILYGQAQDATGIDLNPTRQNEGRLINLNDSANATHNALSQEQARFETAGPLAKVGGLARSVMQAKTPLGAALQATERPTTFVSPTENFNGVMRDIFRDVQARRADRTFGGIRAPGMVSPVTPGAARMLPQNVAGYNTGWQMPAPSQPFEPPGYQY